jgi:hypothetical protein
MKHAAATVHRLNRETFYTMITAKTMDRSLKLIPLVGHVDGRVIIVKWPPF